MKDRNVLATLAAFVFSVQVAVAAEPVCGDVNDNGAVSTSDALLVLKTAVGQPVSLTCARCGSSCAGDPRFLLGLWTFQSDFDGTVYEDHYDLSAVDEAYCQIVGEDLDDRGVVYAYAGDSYDYVLLDSNETFCDLFVFDRVGPDEVEGVDMVYDLDVNGDCDFDALFSEGPMIGDRVTSAAAMMLPARDAAETTGSRSSKIAAQLATSQSTRQPRPELAALVESVRLLYSRHRSR